MNVVCSGVTVLPSDLVQADFLWDTNTAVKAIVPKAKKHVETKKALEAIRSDFTGQLWVFPQIVSELYCTLTRSKGEFKFNNREVLPFIDTLVNDAFTIYPAARELLLDVEDEVDQLKEIIELYPEFAIGTKDEDKFVGTDIYDARLAIYAKHYNIPFIVTRDGKFTKFLSNYITPITPEEVVTLAAALK